MDPPDRSRWVVPECTEWFVGLGKKAASLNATPPTPWKGSQTLDVVDGPTQLAPGSAAMTSGNPLAVVCHTLDEVREVAARAVELAPQVRAVLAPFIPSGAVSLFSGVGIAALRFDAAGAKSLKGQRSVALPPLAQWGENEPTVVAFGAQKVSLTWLALGSERGWVTAGTSRPAPTRQCVQYVRARLEQ